MSSVYSPYGGMQLLPCQRCQAALPPNEAYCRNCGYNNAVNQGAPQAPSAMGGWGESAPPQQGQYGGPSWGQPPMPPPSSPMAPPPQAANGPRPSSSGLLRSSGGNFFGAPGAPTPNMQDNLGQGMSSMPPSFASRPPTGTLSGGPAPQAPYGMPPAGPAPFGGQGQYPAGFGAPDTSPPQYSMPGMPPAGFGAPDTSPPQYSMPGMPPAGFGAPDTSPPQYSMPGMPPAGFGAPNTSPSQPLGPQYSMPGMPPAGFGAPGMSAAQPQYGMMPGVASNASSSGWPGQQPGNFAGPGVSPAQPAGTQYGMMPGMASNASSFAQQAGRDMQAPAFNTGTAARRKPKPWLIALIIVLVVVLAGGGFAGYMVLKAQKSAATKVTSVATLVPQGPALFADTFKDNTNKWNLQSYPNEFAVSIANNSLVLEDDQHELLWELVPGAKPYSDFTLSVDSMLSQGQQNNGYGIYIRGSSIQNSELGTYYRFEIYGDGSYAIFKGALNTTSVKLVDYTLNSAIHKEGSVNHIAITAKGSSMSLTVNGQVIKTISDSSYVSGSIAFFVSNLQNATAGAKAQFSHLAIYPA